MVSDLLTHADGQVLTPHVSQASHLLVFAQRWAPHVLGS